MVNFASQLLIYKYIFILREFLFILLECFVYKWWVALYKFLCMRVLFTYTYSRNLRKCIFYFALFHPFDMKLSQNVANKLDLWQYSEEKKKTTICFVYYSFDVCMSCTYAIQFHIKLKLTHARVRVWIFVHLRGTLKLKNTFTCWSSFKSSLEMG